MASIRARCGLGGPAPCFDDLCHGVDQTICRLELGVDFCEHDNVPGSCDECRDLEDDWFGGDWREDPPGQDGLADEDGRR